MEIQFREITENSSAVRVKIIVDGALKVSATSAQICRSDDH